VVLAGLTGVGSLWADDVIPSGSLPATLNGNGSQVIVIEATKARTWAMLIELELLGDPATFPYSLKAQANAKGMELQGYVPNTVVRDRALVLAKKVCPMHIADGIVIQRNLGLPLPAVMPEDLEAAVHERLAQASPSSHADVKLAENGQVTLTGRSDSLLAKLECSRGLRGMKGVTAIKNDLFAPDGLPAFTGQVTQALYIPESTPQVVQAGAGFAGTAPPVRVENQGQGAQPAPNAAAPKPALLDRLFNRKPTAAKPTPVKSTSQKSTEVAKEPLKPSTPQSSPPQVVVPTQPAAPLAQSTVATPVHIEPVKPVAALPASKSSVRTSIMPPPPVTPAPGILSQEVANKATLPPLDDIKTVAARTPTPSRDQILPAPEDVQPAATPAKPSTAPTAAKPAGAPSVKVQTALKNKIRTTVGPQAKNVDLQFDGEGGMTVVLYLASDANLDPLVKKLMQIPDLHAYEVKMDVKVQQ
jgi:hypothetical protein